MGALKEDLIEYCKAIYETVLEEVTSWLNFAKETWPLILLAIGAIGTVIWLAKPAPPRSVLMASGTQGGSYEVILKKYVEYFAKHGVKLELVPTLGAEDNINRMRDPKDRLKAALIQSGLITEENSHGLQSLGSIAYEPIWIFYREDKFQGSNLNAENFMQHTVAIGEVGSGTHRQAMNILKLRGLQNSNNLVTISNKDGIDALLRGDVSAIFIVDGFESENIQRLIHEKSVKLKMYNFDRAAAYTRLMSYFHHLVVPEGSLNLEFNLPHRDINLISSTTNLVIDPTLHPAIQLLFLKAATDINGGRSFFTKYGEFPAFKSSIIQESPVAQHFYEKGSPALLKYVPFWLAEFIDRMIVLLLPLVAFLYPVIKAMPAYRTNRALSRINQLLSQLKVLERDVLSNFDAAMADDYKSQINDIENRALSLKVPGSLIGNYFSLRKNIHFVHELIARQSKPENSI